MAGREKKGEDKNTRIQISLERKDVFRWDKEIRIN